MPKTLASGSPWTGGEQALRSPGELEMVVAHFETEPGGRQESLYHGARTGWAPGSHIDPAGEPIFLTHHLDAAIWAAELAEGEERPHVYRVETMGHLEDIARQANHVPPPHPEMTLCTKDPLLVIDEVTEWDLYHGTRAVLRSGDLVEPGCAANFGPTPRTANFVYFARTLEAAIWGAELAAGAGRERIYLVEPTGPVEEDPNLTNARFRGNPTKSFRSRAPLRVTGELLGWDAHPPEVVRKMKEGLARLNESGVEPDDGRAK